MGRSIVREPHADAPRCDSPSGLSGKLLEVGAFLDAVLYLFRDGLRHSLVHCTPFTASRSQALGSSFLSSQEEAGLGKNSDLSFGHDGVFGTATPLGQTVQAGPSSVSSVCIGVSQRSIGTL